MSTPETEETPKAQPAAQPAAPRRKKTGEGRERYLDMVQRERSLLMQQGISRSTEQLLDQAGASAITQEEAEQRSKDTATGDQLRSILPVQAWLPLSIHLIGLDRGILKIAPLFDLTQRQQDSLVSVVRRSGFFVERIEMEVWDRAELIETLR
ncbi:MAG: hypothetical protein KGQ41_09225, partial [Alphaproteobacteria bacterium]|nr:hypothetical protein [Alphaproteobacteria bacterium]